MPGTKDLCHPETVRVAASHQAEAEKIAAELAAIASSGMVLPGSITQRRTRCGRRNCACHADPPRLHGPYWQWTRKIAAKTICRWLTADQHRDYRLDRQRPAAARTARPARSPRRRRLRRRPPLGTASPSQASRRNRTTPPDRVGSARLTCGQPSSQTPFRPAQP